MQGVMVRRSLSIETWRQLALTGAALPVRITLDGESMRPLIRRGRELVTILPMMREVKIGDVVLFRNGPGRYVVHRVFRLRNGMVQTLGDHCMKPDRWMPREDVWGLVVRLDRFGRSWRLDTAAARVWGRIWMALHPLRTSVRRCGRLAGGGLRRISGMNKRKGSHGSQHASQYRSQPE